LRLQLGQRALDPLFYDTGPAAIAWRSDHDRDFLPANRTTFQVKSSGDWETHEIKLPASGTIIHVRIHLPEGTSLIREVELKP
jgi:hypothetical protein